MGARPIAPPIAAAASHGAMYLTVVFIVLSSWMLGAVFGYVVIIASQQNAVVNADIHFPLRPAGMRIRG
jgi:hypothetical protein